MNSSCYKQIHVRLDILIRHVCNQQAVGGERHSALQHHHEIYMCFLIGGLADLIFLLPKVGTLCWLSCVLFPLLPPPAARSRPYSKDLAYYFGNGPITQQYNLHNSSVSLLIYRIVTALLSPTIPICSAHNITANDLVKCFQITT